MIISIKNEKVHLELLQKFLESIPEGSSRFRYFSSRSLSVIENHLVTLIYLENGQPMGYGHLDSEGGKVWLGVAVADVLQGKGIGTLLVERLLAYAKQNQVETVWLSVDKPNKAAIHVYEKLGFTLRSEKTNYLLYTTTLL